MYDNLRAWKFGTINVLNFGHKSRSTCESVDGDLLSEAVDVKNVLIKVGEFSLQNL